MIPARFAISFILVFHLKKVNSQHLHLAKSPRESLGLVGCDSRDKSSPDLVKIASNSKATVHRIELGECPLGLSAPQESIDETSSEMP